MHHSENGNMNNSMNNNMNNNSNSNNNSNKDSNKDYHSNNNMCTICISVSTTVYVLVTFLCI